MPIQLFPSLSNLWKKLSHNNSSEIVSMLSGVLAITGSAVRSRMVDTQSNSV
ncbi:hypothetical protein GCM10010911_41590 [Paenibacillus nasutitermitis]|uniref:Uncharacterized protein n=1 Tax=Paenibacillus nasutitermitis TaxID=1652958 RepID=A0A917DXD5_9BACL|nr:hypothetical protein GCM10010911_41590 [Paenibacillus nasutitermitis]